MIGVCILVGCASAIDSGAAGHADTGLAIVALVVEGACLLIELRYLVNELGGSHESGMSPVRIIGTYIIYKQITYLAGAPVTSPVTVVNA